MINDYLFFYRHIVFKVNLPKRKNLDMFSVKINQYDLHIYEYLKLKH